MRGEALTCAQNLSAQNVLRQRLEWRQAPQRVRLLRGVEWPTTVFRLSHAKDYKSVVV